MSDRRAEPRGAAASRPTAAWIALFAACCALLTASDAVLIARTTDFFGPGFVIEQPLLGGARIAAFVLSSLALDAALVLASFAAILPLLAKLRLSPLQRWLAAALVALVPALTFNYVRYEVQAYVGHLLDTGILLALAGGTLTEMVAQSSSQLVGLLAKLALAAAFVAALFFAVRAARTRASLAPPVLRTLALALGAVLAVDAVLLPGVCLSRAAICPVVSQKPSGMLISAGVRRLTDFDLDGYGWAERPIDRAPFDSQRHPYALDVPGNGADENDLAGDLPLDFRPPETSANPAPVFARRPDVLVVFLEGVRADILGTQLGGKPITPALDALSAESAQSQLAFANSPYTARSRAQLVSGRLDPQLGGTTLVDDFRRNGYEVAWFSGQDESFGARDVPLIGLDRVDYYYDATLDRERSVSSVRTSGSLTVSWRRVNDRIASYLASRTDPRPLFIWVSYGDTHFPYDHGELDDFFGRPRLARGEIGPGRVAELFDTYANSVANVDRAIAGVLASLNARTPARELAVLVTSDHGEALFEKGVLGHGLALDDAQTRVPLIARGFRGTWPEPISLAEVRALVQRSLAADAPAEEVRFARDPNKRIVQYMAKVDRPRLLALRGVDFALHLDTLAPTEPWLELAPNASAPATDPELRTLAHWWETLQLEAARPAPK